MRIIFFSRWQILFSGLAVAFVIATFQVVKIAASFPATTAETDGKPYRILSAVLIFCALACAVTNFVIHIRARTAFIEKCRRENRCTRCLKDIRMSPDRCPRCDPDDTDPR